jgi:hypothetical protein
MQVIKGVELGPLSPEDRREEAYQLRIRTAGYYRAHRIPVHRNNGDEHHYKNDNYYANYTKGLPHDSNGEVNPNAYRALLNALENGRPEDFEALPTGTSTSFIGFTDPQSGLAFDLEGIDPHQLTLPPCFRFSSADAIGEIAENYWLAICRDIPFSQYDSDPIIAAAVSDLNNYIAFHGPADSGTHKVTAKTLFRGNTPGDLTGPYLSQFLITDVPYGSQQIAARVRYALPATNSMVNEVEYLTAQNGQKPTVVPMPIASPRIILSGRNLGDYVHIDELFQAYLNACLLLITPKNRGGFQASISEGNPYFSSKTQVGFGTLGEPNFKAMVAEVATRALKAVWFQKWYVHRRLRPEAFGARLHWHLAKGRSYDFHPGELAKLTSGVLSRPEIVAASYFLPMAFPEGSPTHPAYGAGHATVAGACVTILKALFQEDEKLSDLGITPMQPNSNGTALVPYTGADADQMTISGELNKLASNIGIGRNFAGVHWRSDYTESAKLGEQVALWLLTDYVQTYNERVNFQLTRFDGRKVTIQNGFSSAAEAAV